MLSFGHLCRFWDAVRLSERFLIFTLILMVVAIAMVIAVVDPDRRLSEHPG